MAKVTTWQSKLKVDPLPALLASGDEALRYYVRSELLEENAGSVQALWQLGGAQKILKKQGGDGSWAYPGKKTSPDVKYPLVETWKQFRYLIDMYGFTREHPAVQKAADFLFSCQTQHGDLRGFIANQYASYYTGAVLSLLIKAGYQDEEGVEKGMQWLLSMRQDDLGWTVPILTHNFDGATMYRLTSQYAETIEPERGKPFSHNWTGMVLRAFAAHSRYRHSEAAKTAAHLLKSRFFQPDCYTSYQAASYWVRFQYPFWWNNLVAALDTVSRIDKTMDAAMEYALNWLAEYQEKDGLWKASYVPGKEVRNNKTRDAELWVSLAICRVLKRMYAQA